MPFLGKILQYQIENGRQELEGSQPVDLQTQSSGNVPNFQNSVSTVNLDCKLDLRAVVLRARNAIYKPKRFGAVIMRIREPKTTGLIFASGKMVCIGAKSELESKLAARKYARIIQRSGFPAKFKDFRIQNIDGSCEEGLAYAHKLGLVLGKTRSNDLKCSISRLVAQCPN